jgi:hypothetical protein
MGFDSTKMPDLMEAGMKQLILDHLKDNGLDTDELTLFAWYAKETENIAQQMLANEVAIVKKQYESGAENVNDSGVLPVQYFIRRSRYSHVIYLASLGEAYMTNATKRLTAALGDNVIFTLNELSGDKWPKQRKYLQRYGDFEIPDDIWGRYKSIYDLRNDLVHENGGMDLLDEREREKRNNRYKGIPGLNLEGSEIVIEPSFLDYSFESLRAFIDFVDEKIAAVIERTAKHCSPMV